METVQQNLRAMLDMARQMSEKNPSPFWLGEVDRLEEALRENTPQDILKKQDEFIGRLTQ